MANPGRELAFEETLRYTSCHWFLREGKCARGRKCRFAHVHEKAGVPTTFKQLLDRTKNAEILAAHDAAHDPDADMNAAWLDSFRKIAPDAGTDPPRRLYLVPRFDASSKRTWLDVLSAPTVAPAKTFRLCGESMAPWPQLLACHVDPATLRLWSAPEIVASALYDATFWGYDAAERDQGLAAMVAESEELDKQIAARGIDALLASGELIKLS